MSDTATQIDSFKADISAVCRKHGIELGAGNDHGVPVLFMRAVREDEALAIDGLDASDFISDGFAERFKDGRYLSDFGYVTVPGELPPNADKKAYGRYINSAAQEWYIAKATNEVSDLVVLSYDEWAAGQ